MPALVEEIKAQLDKARQAVEEYQIAQEAAGHELARLNELIEQSDAFRLATKPDAQQSA